MTKRLVPCECKHCGYKWNGRGREPVACPKCKRYDWKKGEEKKCMKQI